ncbi:hypothetical protein RCL1_002967 [Eukaryota sp. TZLM3-RCL]
MKFRVSLVPDASSLALTCCCRWLSRVYLIYRLLKFFLDVEANPGPPKQRQSTPHDLLSAKKDVASRADLRKVDYIYNYSDMGKTWSFHATSEAIGEDQELSRDVTCACCAWISDNHPTVASSFDLLRHRLGEMGSFKGRADTLYYLRFWAVVVDRMCSKYVEAKTNLEKIENPFPNLFDGEVFISQHFFFCRLNYQQQH